MKALMFWAETITAEPTKTKIAPCDDTPGIILSKSD